MPVDIIRVGRPDRGRLLISHGTAAIGRYLTDSSLGQTDRQTLDQLRRSLGKLTSSNGLIYVENGLTSIEGYAQYVHGREEDPLNSAFIKLYDPEATTDHDTLLFRVRNPITVYESEIKSALRQRSKNLERGDDMLRGAFSDFDGGSGKIKPSVEIALIQRDASYSVEKPGARIRWEWDTRGYRVVTRGHVPGRNDIIPDKTPGGRRQEVPIISFTRMRNGVILQAIS